MLQLHLTPRRKLLFYVSPPAVKKFLQLSNFLIKEKQQICRAGSLVGSSEPASLPAVNSSKNKKPDFTLFLFTAEKKGVQSLLTETFSVHSCDR